MSYHIVIDMKNVICYSLSVLLRKCFRSLKKSDQWKVFLVFFPPINCFPRRKVRQQISTTYRVLNFLIPPALPSHVFSWLSSVLIFNEKLIVNLNPDYFIVYSFFHMKKTMFAKNPTSWRVCPISKIYILLWGRSLKI